VKDDNIAWVYKKYGVMLSISASNQ